MTTIDITKLENVRFLGDKTLAGCPVCFSLGGDRKKEHLCIQKTGAFSCVIMPGDKNHNKQILQLVGIESGTSGEDVEEHEAKIEVERTYDISLLDKLVKNYSYWEGRGISGATIEEFRGGIATEGQMKNRWVFPIFNENEEIIGFTGRALVPEMQIRWKHIGQKSKWIFGGIEEIETTKRIVLVESPGDLFMLFQNEIKDVLTLFGTNLSQTLLGKIISLNPDEIIIATNNDTKEHQAGQNASLRIMSILLKFFNHDKIKITLPIAKDWGEESKENILKLLNS